VLDNAFISVDCHKRAMFRIIIDTVILIIDTVIAYIVYIWYYMPIMITRTSFDDI